MSIFGVFGEPQKAKHLYQDEELKVPKHVGKTYAIMEKFDGWYMYIDCIDGEWQGIRSKTGRMLESMQYYSNQFSETIVPKKNIRIIFEATLPDPKEQRGIMVFAKANGLFNQKHTRLKNVTLRCHDMLIEGKSSLEFSERYTKLGACIGAINWNSDLNLDLVTIQCVSPHKEDWMEVYREIISRGGEGIIGKNTEGLYKAGKRNEDVIKVKCEVTLECLVVGKLAGVKGSKYENTLGKLVVRQKSGIEHAVSGMTDEQRDLWWNDFSLIDKQVVELQAMKILKNGSLREGRFKAVRHDKTEKDID